MTQWAIDGQTGRAYSFRVAGLAYVLIKFAVILLFVKLTVRLYVSVLHVNLFYTTKRIGEPELCFISAKYVISV